MARRQASALLADITGDGRADIVGFGDAGVWTALSQARTARSPTRSSCWPISAIEAGGWRVDKHPRFLADLRGNGRADIVGFGDAGVYVALSNGDGTFQPPQFVVADFGLEAGGWRVDKHPRFLADITGNGHADIVGFGDAGVYVALGNGDGTFQPPQFVLATSAFEAGGWRVDKHPRFLADLTGDGRADIVGFGDAGVYVALSNGDGTFQHAAARHHRLRLRGRRLARRQAPALPRRHHRQRPRRHRRLRRRRRLRRARATATARSSQPQFVLADFGFDAGGWRVDKHPRFLADVTGDGRADIVGFGNDGVYVAFSNGDGTFSFTAAAGHQRLRFRCRRLARRQAPARPRRRHRRRPRRQSSASATPACWSA